MPQEQETQNIDAQDDQQLTDEELSAIADGMDAEEKASQGGAKEEATTAVVDGAQVQRLVAHAVDERLAAAQQAAATRAEPPDDDEPVSRRELAAERNRMQTQLYLERVRAELANAEQKYAGDLESGQKEDLYYLALRRLQKNPDLGADAAYRQAVESFDQYAGRTMKRRAAKFLASRQKRGEKAGGGSQKSTKVRDDGEWNPLDESEVTRRAMEVMAETESQ